YDPSSKLHVPAASNPGLDPDPYERQDHYGNLLTYGGASALWYNLIGGGVYFDDYWIEASTSTTAAAATQQSQSGTVSRKAGDAAPIIATGTGSSNNAKAVFSATWGTSDGNFAWESWAIFNASTSGRMLNRRVVSLGTKTNSDTWTLE